MNLHGIKALPNGNVIDFNNVSDYNFTVEEIAELLSHIKRFNGVGFSVAKHSVIVAKELLHRTNSKGVALLGLFHDAAEAYIGDVVSPVKDMLGDAWKNLEYRIQREILWKFGVLSIGNPVAKLLVAEIDKAAMAAELKHLVAWGKYTLDKQGVWEEALKDVGELTCDDIPAVVNDDSKAAFLQLYDELTSTQSGE